LPIYLSPEVTVRVARKDGELYIRERSSGISQHVAAHLARVPRGHRRIAGLTTVAVCLIEGRVVGRHDDVLVVANRRLDPIVHVLYRLVRQLTALRNEVAEDGSLPVQARLHGTGRHEITDGVPVTHDEPRVLVVAVQGIIPPIVANNGRVGGQDRVGRGRQVAQEATEVR